MNKTDVVPTPYSLNSSKVDIETLGKLLTGKRKKVFCAKPEVLRALSCCYCKPCPSRSVLGLAFIPIVFPEAFQSPALLSVPRESLGTCSRAAAKHLEHHHVAWGTVLRLWLCVPALVFSLSICKTRVVGSGAPLLRVSSTENQSSSMFWRKGFREEISLGN